MEMTVLIAEDSKSYSASLVSILDKAEGLRVIGNVQDGEQAARFTSTLKPTVVLMDVVMPNMSGIQATRLIKYCSPETKVLAISFHGEKQLVQEMINAGASGYLLKEDASDHLVAAIRAVHAGEQYLSPQIQHLLD